MSKLATATILLVEDEPAIRGLMASALERAGYRVIQARNGQEALKVFDATVDLLLTDMLMPHVGGRRLITLLREQRRTLKVLSFSGIPLNAPMEDSDILFLDKPFSRGTLLKAVRDLLAGG
jgi:two-component system, cell cycle sensor histidine kinase and response regulator CckA